MKKDVRKLQFKRETVRTLDAADLAGVAGAGTALRFRGRIFAVKCPATTAPNCGGQEPPQTTAPNCTENGGPATTAIFCD